MFIRPVLPTDLKLITTIDTSYSTTRVWQMEQKFNDEEISTYFRTIRLPREVRVDPPQDHSWMDNWKKKGIFLVAVEGLEVVGYLELTVEDVRRIGTINHLAVQPKKRRSGIGSALVMDARRWCQSRRLSTVMAEISTKNYPTIKFFQKCGFNFSGFSDIRYPERDIAVFFSYSIGWP